MSKYFDTKPGSLEEAVSAAQQAAIAISKKERGEKPKDEGNAFGAALQAAKEKGEDTFVVAGKKYDVKTEQEIKEEKLDEKVEYVEYKFKNKNDAMAAKKMLDAVQLMSFDINDDNISGGELMVDAGSKDMTKYHKEIMKKFKPKVMKTETNKNDKSDDGDGLDAVQPKAVKKKFADRKDKDIDNDGDVDDSDKFLHKRRKAVSKAMGEEISEEKFRMMIEALTELSPALLKRAADAAAKRASDDGKKATAADKRDSNVKKGMMPKAGSAADKADTKYRASKARADRIARGAADAADREAEKEYQKQKKAKQNEGVSLKDSILNMWKEAQDVLNDKDGDGMDDDQKPEKSKAKKMTDTGKPVTPIETSPKMPKTKNEKNKV